MANFTPVDLVMTLAGLLLVAWTIVLLANAAGTTTIVLLPLLSVALIIYSRWLERQRSGRHRGV